MLCIVCVRLCVIIIFFDRIRISYKSFTPHRLHKKTVLLRTFHSTAISFQRLAPEQDGTNRREVNNNNKNAHTHTEPRPLWASWPVQTFFFLYYFIQSNPNVDSVCICIHKLYHFFYLRFTCKAKLQTHTVHTVHRGHTQSAFILLLVECFLFSFILQSIFVSLALSFSLFVFSSSSSLLLFRIFLIIIGMPESTLTVSLLYHLVLRPLRRKVCARLVSVVVYSLLNRVVVSTAYQRTES